MLQVLYIAHLQRAHSQERGSRVFNKVEHEPCRTWGWGKQRQGPREAGGLFKGCCLTGLLEQKEGGGVWPFTHEAWSPKAPAPQRSQWGFAGQCVSADTQPSLPFFQHWPACLSHLHVWLSFRHQHWCLPQLEALTINYLGL